LAFIPAFIRVRQTAGTEAAERLLGGATVLVVGLLAGITIPVLALFPVYLDLVAAKFTAADRTLAGGLLLILAPFAILRGVGVLWGATLNATRGFLLPALTPVLTPLLATAALLTFRGVDALAWAMVLGMACEAIVVAVAMRAQGFDIRPRWLGRTPALRQLVGQFAAVAAGNAILAMTTIIDQSMAAMVSPASISVLYFASLLVLFPATLGGAALGTATLPYASEMAAARQWTALRRTIAVSLRYVVLMTVPFTVAVVAFAGPVVALIYYRGAFTAADTMAVTDLVRYLAPMIPFYLGATVAIQVLSALRRNQVLLWASLMGLALKVALNYGLLAVMGLPGIGLSTTLCYAATMTFALVFCRRALKAQADGPEG
jgi:putative peptidoglycan lipid II flippase